MSAATAQRIREADAYLNTRTGCYAYRCERYDAALEFMHANGLADTDTVVDVGAGMGEFGSRLHTGRLAEGHTEHIEGGGYWALDVAPISPSRGRYWPVDAAIDGTDLHFWTPPRDYEWFVCLELLEHLANPARLLTEMVAHATKGVIISTPNPERTDVLGMDSTHRTPITAAFLECAGLTVTERSFYGQEADSLMGEWTV